MSLHSLGKKFFVSGYEIESDEDNIWHTEIETSKKKKRKVEVFRHHDNIPNSTFQDIESMETPSQKEELIKFVNGALNSRGGLLYIGMNKGVVFGCLFGKTDVTSFIEPAFHPEEWKILKKTFIKITSHFIFSSESFPYKEKGGNTLKIICVSVKPLDYKLWYDKFKKVSVMSCLKPSDERGVYFREFGINFLLHGASLDLFVKNRMDSISISDFKEDNGKKDVPIPEIGVVSLCTSHIHILSQIICGFINFGLLSHIKDDSKFIGVIRLAFNGISLENLTKYLTETLQDYDFWKQYVEFEEFRIDKHLGIDIRIRSVASDKITRITSSQPAICSVKLDGIMPRVFVLGKDFSEQPKLIDLRGKELLGTILEKIL
ncbi:hypothetical protein ADUPG1_009321 [Aduncisulcus paluster]|uniref:Schlafen AlbA-2 domain-containing protein n=1 Tax=Aduncisulcus paluster TaxID=2918883 RepID=A0ABQ5KV49_9EUKA|nr:hypothetical protein ADUPG1_009321 [Aduncisulcus paluster]